MAQGAGLLGDEAALLRAPRSAGVRAVPGAEAGGDAVPVGEEEPQHQLAHGF